MPCEIVWHAIPEGPHYYAGGTCPAVAQCVTHNWWDVPRLTQSLPGAKACPIGRIEQAVEEALAKIAAAK